MVGLIDKNCLKVLVFLFILLTFIQVTEYFMSSSYIETKQDNGDILGSVLSYLSDLPFIGFLLNFFIITIPNTPWAITILLNLINSIIWIYFAINLNNLVIQYFNLDEGLFGWLN